MLKASVWLSTAMLVIASSNPAVAADVSPESSPVPVVEAFRGLGDANRPAVLMREGQWLKLFQAGGRVVFQAGDSEPMNLDDEADIEGGRAFRLVSDGTRLYAFWWTKVADASKRLYVRVSEDWGQSFSPLTAIDTLGQVLPDYDVRVIGDGKVIVAYTDERAPRYQIYMNRTVDGGQTWWDADKRLDTTPISENPGSLVPDQPQATAQAGKQLLAGAVATEPRFVTVGDRIIAMWKEAVRNESGGPVAQVSVRWSDDNGESWSDVVPVHARTARSPVADEVVTALDDGTLIAGVFDYPEGFLAYRSNDKGETWEYLSTIPGSDKFLAASQIQVQAHGDRVTFLYSVDRHKKKPQVHVATVDAKTGEWIGSGSFWISEKPFEENMSWNPALTLLASGELVAVWEDYQAIRPSIRIRTSSDSGDSWAGEGLITLDEAGVHTDGWPRFKSAGDAEIYVEYFRWKDDGMTSRDLMLQKLPMTDDGHVDLNALPKNDLPPIEDRKARLEERAREYWKARVEARYADAYTFYDPVYRAMVPEIGFMSTQGTVLYKSFELKEALVWDRIGGAVVVSQFEVPRVKVTGEDFNVPLTTDEYRQEWVWVDDDWYVVFESTMGNRFLKY